MSMFWTGFGAGLGSSINDRFEEDRKYEQQQKLLGLKAKYEVAVEDMQARKKRTREIDQTTEDMRGVFGSDATDEEIAGAVRAKMMGADMNKIMKVYNQRRLGRANPNPGGMGGPPLPGMGPGGGIGGGHNAGEGMETTDMAPGTVQQDNTVTSAPVQHNTSPVAQLENSGGYFSPDFKPENNAKVVKGLEEQLKDYKDAFMPQSLIDRFSSDIETLRNHPDSEEAGSIVARTSQYYSDQAAKLGYTSSMKADRSIFIESLKSAGTKAYENGDPVLAGQIFNLLPQVNSTMNFADVQAKGVALMQKVPSMSFKDKNEAAQTNLQRERLQFDKNKELAKPAEQAAQQFEVGGQYDEAYRARQQAAQLAVNGGQVPEIDVSKTNRSVEDNNRAYSYVLKVLDPTAQTDASGNIFVVNKKGERKTKMEYGQAINAALQMAQYRQRTGATDKPLEVDAANLVSFFKDNLPMDFADEKPAQADQNGKVPDPKSTLERGLGTTSRVDSSKTPEHNKQRDKFIKSWIANEDFKKSDPATWGFLVRQVYKNSDQAQRKELDRVTKGTPSSPKSLPANTTEPVQEPPKPTYKSDNVFDSSVVDRENADVKQRVIAQDKQRIEQEKAEGKPKRDSVEEYAAKLESMPDHEAEAYMKYNPFKGDPKDLEEYATATAKVADTKKIAADPELSKITEELNSSAKEINQFARDNVDLKDLLHQDNKEPYRTVVAERRLKMIEKLDDERYTQFLDAITDDNLKKFFERIRKSTKKVA